MRKHIQVLGILNIVWGSFGLIAALFLMIIFGGVIGIIQAASHGDPDALFAVPIVGLIGGIILAIVLIASIPAVVAGIGLLRMTSWSRILTIIVSALHLFSIPFGTALGIYGLWVMLSDETVRLLSAGHNSIAVRSAGGP
ncbi:MAG: hypothetical protein HXY20_05855 [Acidobacteria bacterium]|nr:hypothetical protein [Acidobacteriota bacterium]